MILIFWTKLAQKGISKKNKISLGTEFQLKLTIWIFWTKVVQKRIISGEKQKN